MSAAPKRDPTSTGAHGAALNPRRSQSHRTIWHAAGLLLALAIAWLVFGAYRQPDFLLDFVNLRLC